ncbi:cyclase family protein [Halalkalibacter urbisdiaboli]|uniref:cyclase family protein n=1 Tax=Halalkalibacter urbisdiaboli TaxID=1960589 RepID=UPI000B454B8D|nr:cyclase family protein [Halalkalibacter urbisdiaboli]
MYIDLTQLIKDGMPVYPGDSESKLVQSSFLEKDFYTNHELTINMHTGTHIDGPMHLTDTNVYINEFPLDTFIGEGCLLNVTGEKSIDYKEVYEQQIKEKQIVILYTGHSKYFGQEKYYNEYPVLTKAFADLLVRKQVKMVGMDTPSPDQYPFDIHKLFFRNQILIIENLTNVAKLENAKSFEIMALPLHIQSDSSIARVVARIK